jgi:4'-phosphopantetheinyl transferase
MLTQHVRALAVSGRLPRERIVHVWHAAPALAAPAESRRACLDLLDPVERERLGRFRFDVDAVAYLAAHALLRSALSCFAPVHPRTWRFRGGMHGKPVVEKPALHRRLSFSLSHTSGRVAIAVGRHCELGIDVEDANVGASLLENPERFLSPAEVESLRTLPPEARADRFLACWTLKESLLKALGIGLSIPPQDLGFDLDKVPDPRVSFPRSMPEDPASWHFRRFSATDRHPVALAIRCQPGSNVLVWITEASELPLRFASKVPGPV